MDNNIAKYCFLCSNVVCACAPVEDTSVAGLLDKGIARDSITQSRALEHRARHKSYPEEYNADDYVPDDNTWGQKDHGQNASSNDDETQNSPNGHETREGSPKLHTGVDETRGRSMHKLHVALNNVASDLTGGGAVNNKSLSSLRGFVSETAIIPAGKVALLEDAPVGNEAAKEFRRFKELPAELRLIIWEIAFTDAHPPRRPMQRFRFNLVFDHTKNNPNQNDVREPTGWVACFSPVHMKVECDTKCLGGPHPHHVFLTTCAETRAMMFRSGMSMLTMHELPIDSGGQYMAPRKVHIPFNVSKGVFCIDGLTRALEEAPYPKQGPWSQQHFASILQHAHGLRFAPRVKHVAFIPPSSTELFWGPFFQSSTGQGMASLAMQFPHLATVTSAIPQRCRPEPGYHRHYCASTWLLCKTASLVGKRQGGLFRTSDEDRVALFANALRQIFDDQKVRCSDLFFEALFYNRVGLPWFKTKTKTTDSANESADNVRPSVGWKHFHERYGRS